MKKDLIDTHIVDTPASIADDSVSADEGEQAISARLGRHLNATYYLQHWSPIKNANSNTGAVYCPSAL